MSSSIKLISSNLCFGGHMNRFSHQSSVTNCEMKFSVYLPPAAQHSKVPVLWYLSGLTCTDENFVQKAGAQRVAASCGLALVSPDTSPRVEIEGDRESWDFGVGAGFYLDATVPKWANHYKMYTYITKELAEIINNNFPVLPDKQSITGHSMGGHGALTIALKNPNKFKSVSAFAPISNPMECPWGQKAFRGYLGENKEDWKQYDASYLLQHYKGPNLNILVDQGTEDNFLKQKQLLPEALTAASQQANIPITVNMREGYDHSYFFIATFIEEHILHHMKYLK